jgi:hypothetical protein
MKKIILIAGILLASFNAAATVESRIFTCVDRKNNFQFDVKFEGGTARVWVQGSVYNVKYQEVFTGRDGKIVRVYGNQEFKVFTSYPNDKFVSMQTNERSPQPIAAAHCD